MQAEKTITNINEQPFYEINNNLSTIKSLLIFLDLSINGEIIIENKDLANITTLLKELIDKTSKTFEEIEHELKV